MDDLKTEHEVKMAPAVVFPAFESLSAIPARRLKTQVSKRFRLLSGGDPVVMAQELDARGRLLEGLNARDEGFEVGKALSAADIAPQDYVYLNWYRFDDIDRLRLRDLDAWFEDIWYPGSDSLDVFDDSLVWMLSIARHGAVKLIRNS